ncbi:MAG: cell wall metabolism sensor histidine kinase WalK, partial [Chloroflexi bacterium]|nr:cell wall metabolism sensor histidine kinase WalK [Chloroflexota bacterium]
DSELVRRAGGRGLGLLFAKAIVEQHHGKIWVESKVGGGSSFYFSIPKTRPNSDAPA